MDEIKKQIAELRALLDSGQITIEEFKRRREPLKAALARLMFS